MVSFSIASLLNFLNKNISQKKDSSLPTSQTNEMESIVPHFQTIFFGHQCTRIIFF